MRSERIAPRLEFHGQVVEAVSPCDLCVTRVDHGIRVSVAHSGADLTCVRLPLDPLRFAEAHDAAGGPVELRQLERGIELLVPAIERGGIVTLSAKPDVRMPKKT
jgi:hypothetical protein